MIETKEDAKHTNQLSIFKHALAFGQAEYLSPPDYYGTGESE